MGLHIRLKRPKWFPKVHLPNPIDVVREGVKAVGDAVKLTKKAVDDVLELPKKAAAEVDRNLRKLREFREKTERAASKAIHDTVDAAKAVGHFVDRQARGLREIPNAALHRKNVMSSLWYVATQPIKTTNKNAMRATMESEALGAAAGLAASVYGGPAGAAAYSAWTAYNVSGGDLNVALRVGATQGLVAAASGAIAKMPNAVERKAAEEALHVAIGRVQGKSDEEIKAEALASLVDLAGKYVPKTEMDGLKQSLMTGAMGGLAVAAAGGSRDQIQHAFLESGGSVLVQGAKTEAGHAKDHAELAANALLSRALDDVALRTVKSTYDRAKQLGETGAAKLLTDAKNVVAPVRKAMHEAAVKAQAQAKLARDVVLKKVDTARANAESVLNASEELAEQIQTTTKAAFETVFVQAEKEAKANVADAEKIKAAAQTHVAQIKSDADRALEKLHADAGREIDKAQRDLDAALGALESTREYAVAAIATARGAPPAGILTDEWIISWDKARLNGHAGERPAVVLTYAGPGGFVAGLTDGSVETDEQTEPDAEMAKGAS